MSSRLRFSVLIVMLVAAAPRAQQEPPDKPIFRSGSLLIVETVTVKDKEGRPIEGLTAKDFTLTEDGEPQTISFVEFQRLPGPGTGGPGVAPTVDAPPAPPVAAPVTEAQIAVPPPGDSRYRDRRLLVLY